MRWVQLCSIFSERSCQAYTKKATSSSCRTSIEQDLDICSSSQKFPQLRICISEFCIKFKGQSIRQINEYMSFQKLSFNTPNRSIQVLHYWNIVKRQTKSKARFLIKRFLLNVWYRSVTKSNRSPLYMDYATFLSISDKKISHQQCTNWAIS